MTLESTAMLHALTVDVEDYHNVIARDWLGRDFPPTDAVVRNTTKMLELFARYEATATFFILGEVVEHHPQLARDIVAAGHEIGVHGYYHRQLFKLDPASLRREVSDAKKRIEDTVSARVVGHRAPAFSIMPETAWGLDVLVESGFEYDSSIFPINGNRYGWPGFPLDIHRMTTPGGATIIEAPLTTASLFGRRFPACGGGYLRHFPALYTNWAMAQNAGIRPAIVYLHPYEVEIGAGPLDAAHLPPDERQRVERFHRLQLRNRHTVEPKVATLLQRYSFATLADVIDGVLGASTTDKSP